MIAPEPPAPTESTEHRERFPCFGSFCEVVVTHPEGTEAARAAVRSARARLLEWHERFSRFLPDSELSRLNADPHPTVSVSPMMRRVIQAALEAARRTGGLVDPTLAAEIVRAGYGEHFDGPGLDLAAALTAAPARVPAAPAAAGRWREVSVERATSTVTRSPGVVLDPGGIAKGVFADELAAALGGCDAWAIDCAGDLRLGGRAGLARTVEVESPFDHSVIHRLAIAGGGVATSGIGARSWLDADGRPAHHLLDPATGRPAFTGVVQATALAPTAAEAEALAKAAVLSGPQAAPGWLRHGGVLVLDDGDVRAVAP